MAEETTLGQLVRARREQLGLTGRELARRAGPPLNDVYLSRVETGYVDKPGPEYLSALARGLEMPLDLLVHAIYPLGDASDVADIRAAIAALKPPLPPLPRLAAVAATAETDRLDREGIDALDRSLAALFEAFVKVRDRA